MGRVGAHPLALLDRIISRAIVLEPVDMLRHLHDGRPEFLH
jgi:hypothetical protein